MEEDRKVKLDYKCPNCRKRMNMKVLEDGYYVEYVGKTCKVITCMYCGNEELKTK